MNIKELVINGLYGQAVADAVGNPFEFETSIIPEAVVAYANTTKELVISDDTQMALFGFEAILRKDITLKEAFTLAYTNWYITQNISRKSNQPEDGLLAFNSMHSVQAPGNTCLSSLCAIIDGRDVINDSKGCGSVMRLLPLTLLFIDFPVKSVIEVAKMTGSITHKHKENNLAIARYMSVAYSIIYGEPVSCIDVPHINRLGEGWTALECVEMAVWAYKHSTTYDELLTLSIAHDGDSDSVAAIAGSLWGLSGREVPLKYIHKLDALDAIEYIVKRVNENV